MAKDGLGSSSDAPSLWISDGTPAGTRLLQRFSGTTIVKFLQAGNRYYFTPTSETTGTELWTTDGTAEGTKLVVDLRPGPASGGPVLLGAFNGKIIFYASDSNGDVQLYISDGTTAGTQALGSHLVMHAPLFLEDKFYFSTQTSDYDGQIWVSDGTATGTHQVSNPSGDAYATANATSFVQLGDQVLYRSNYGLFKIDSTTDTIAPLGESANLGRTSLRTDLVNMGDFVLFIGNNALWRSDGTVSGTYRISASPTVDPYPDSVQESLIFGRAGDRLFYLANDGVTGRQLVEQ